MAVQSQSLLAKCPNSCWQQVEGGEVSEEEAAVPAPVAVVEQPKRGGRRKLALAEVEEEVSEKVADQVEQEAPAKKAAGRRKAVAAVEEVAAAAPSPVKRGRRGAAPVQEKEKSPVRRGRKAAVEKIVTEEARYSMCQSTRC